MSADWWARKLGGAPARTPTPQQSAAPSYPQGPATPAYIPPRPPASPAMQVTKDNIMEAAGQWRGGEATKKELAHCPNCGGNNYFSVQNAPGSKVATQHGMATAAGRCFECGYTPHHGLQTGAMG